MNRMNGVGIAVWIALVVGTGFLAFGSGPGSMGSGSMGYGPWHGWGDAGEWNDESRVLGGYGMGPAMMGGMGHARGWNMPYGMMMGRGGMGFGMMGGGQMGPGFGSAPAQLPELNAEQTQKISQFQREAEARNGQLAQQLWAAQDNLNRLQMSAKRDWDAIRAASQSVMDMQRQQVDSNIELQKKIDGLLTDSQRQEWARNWRGTGWMGAQ